MMRSIYFSLIALSALLLSSCGDDFFDQTITIDPPEYAPNMVVNSLFNQEDTELIIQVKRNIGLLEQFDSSNPSLVTGAKIELLREGNPWVEFEADPSIQDPIYTTDLSEKFESGKTYALRVSHDSFPTMYAEQTMPDFVAIDSIRYLEDGGINPGGEELSEIEIVFKDKEGESNYYAMRVFTEYEYIYDIYDNMGNIIGQDTIRDEDMVYLDYSDDPNVELGIGEHALIRDDFFDGDTYRFSFKFSDYGSSNSTYKVVFESITEEIYLNLLARQRYYDTAGSPFAEPTTIFSNFDNGIGIFGLSSAQFYEVE